MLVVAIEDASNKSNAEKVIRNFEEFVSPRLSSFRKGIIHTDLNGHNIILKQDPTGSAYHVAGFIDFNDSIQTCIVFELGVSLAHIMRDMLRPAVTDTVELVGPLVSGYNSVLPLTPDELDSLYHIVLARSVFLAINAERVCRTDPANTAHVISSISKSWAFVHAMLSIPSILYNLENASRKAD